MYINIVPFSLHSGPSEYKHRLRVSSTNVCCRYSVVSNRVLNLSVKVNVQLNFSAGVRGYLVLARLSIIDYSFDAESEMYTQESILGSSLNNGNYARVYENDAKKRGDIQT